MKYMMACHIFEDFQDKTLIAIVPLHHDLSKTKEKNLKNKLKKSATFQILSKLIVNIIFLLVLSCQQDMFDAMCVTVFPYDGRTVAPL